MQVNVIDYNHRSFNLEENPTEIVERKGIGHPDTLADLVAETFSNSYSLITLEKFGKILNHCSDDVVLSGGTAKIQYGQSVIEKPMTAYLFGKATVGVGNDKIDANKIFEESVKQVFLSVFKNKDILDYVKCITDSNDGIGLEHPSEYYQPKSIKGAIESLTTLKSNDTVFCAGYAPYSFTELLTIKIEDYINSTKFKNKFPETGWDVKVMIVRIFKNLDITICIPFIASKTPNHEAYSAILKEIHNNLNVFINNIVLSCNTSYEIELYLNTKDLGEKGYITSFGSALDKGDNGTVGRGNKYSGIISVERETNIEAVSGKNPLHYAGKLYTVLAHNISNDINLSLNIPNYVNISAKNGDLLDKPAYVIVKGGKGISNHELFINNIIKKHLRIIHEYTDWIVKLNPVESHAGIANKYYKST